MKYIIISILSFATTILNAQIAIGKKSINGNSTILDFYDNYDNYKGIILPSLETKPNLLTPSNNGTFIFDKSDKKIKLYENNTWKDLSPEGNIINLNINSSNENNQKQGVIINSDNSLATGVFILESSNKAMILPKIENPHVTVKNPYPGMICYDTIGKVFAVFNGQIWSYWK